MSDNILLELIKQHIETDREQFAAQEATLNRIDANVASLLESRAEQRGAWKLTTVIATAISAGLGIFFAWLGYK